MTVTPLILPGKRWYFTSAWLLWSAAWAATLALWYKLPWGLAVSDSIVSNGLLMSSAFIIGNVLRYYQPGSGKVPFILFFSLVVSALYFSLDRWVLGQVYTANGMKYLLHPSLPLRFVLAFVINTAAAACALLWFYLQEQREAGERETVLKQMAKDAELYKLRQQLQPHFLFNSLNSINALIHSRPQEARRMVQQLSDFLRGTLKREETQFISLEEELHYLRLYLDIEKVRFGHRLDTVIEVPEEALPHKMPPLLLQPLMENAIKFGLYGTTEAVVIRLQANREDGYLLLTLANPFDPEMQLPPGTGFGLKAVKRRLYLVFARNDLIAIRKTDRSFTVTLKIPLLYE